MDFPIKMYGLWNEQRQSGSKRKCSISDNENCYAKFQFEIDKKSSSKIKFNNQLCELEISKIKCRWIVGLQTKIFKHYSLYDQVSCMTSTISDVCKEQKTVHF